MTSTTSTTSTNPFASITPPAAATSTASSGIDQAGFLKLLTTQMTQQDPTAPMDTSTMVQQLT
ncbi:MAG: flagellar hook capping FlgD N-terminal domain-containing protein, partial [Sphingomonas oligoaromativorans]